MMMNIRTHDWDDDLLAIVGVDRSVLPRIVSCSEVYGTGVGCLEGVKIAGISGAESGRRVVGRPASGAVRTDVLRSGRDEEHVRHGVFYSDEHGRFHRGQPERAGHDRGVQDRRHRPHVLRSGGLHHHRGGSGAVASRQPRNDSIQLRGRFHGSTIVVDRGHGDQRGQQRGHVHRPCVLGAVRAALAVGCARRLRGIDPNDQQKPHLPSRAGGHGVSNL